MPLLLAGQIGPQTGSDGNQLPFRQGRAGEQIFSELHGRYYEQTYRKNVFTAYAAAQATTSFGGSVALAGLQLWNGSPLTNGVNLAILKIGGAVIATSAAVTGVVLGSGTGQVSAPTSQTAITRVSNNFIGGVAPQATATAAGTFTNAPTAFMTLLHNTAAIASTGEDGGYNQDLEGIVIVPPQCFIAFGTIGATAAASSNQHHVMWEEVPV